MSQPADPPPSIPPPLRTPPPPLPALPPLSTRREPKRLPMGMKLIAGILMAATALMGFVGGKAFVRRVVLAVRGGNAMDLHDPYATMSRAYAQNPDTFSVGVARGAELGLKRTLRRARVAVGPKAAVTDLGRAMRVVIDYRGEIPTEDRGMAAIEGETRQYIHAGGALSVQTICFTAYSMCLGREELIQRTDEAVLQHLKDRTVDIHPPGGDCSTTRAPEVSRTAYVTLCRMDGDMVIAFTEMSLDDTRNLLKQFTSDPEFKALGKELDAR
jgi:hypothetical protein